MGRCQRRLGTGRYLRHESSSHHWTLTLKDVVDNLLLRRRRAADAAAQRIVERGTCSPRPEGGYPLYSVH